MNLGIERQRFPSLQVKCLRLVLPVALLMFCPPADRGPSLLAAHGHAELTLALDGAPASIATTLQQVVRILQSDLGLPMPVRIAARIYDRPTRFEQGLVAHAAVPATRAAEFAQFAVGATIPGAVFLRVPAGAGATSVEWTRLIAHELTHLAQIELAGGEVGPAQWLTEGMAEWIAYRVVDEKGLGSLADRLPLARAAAVEYVRLADGLDLDALTAPDAFLGQHRRIGTVLTYRLTLHLAAELVAEHTFARLVDYFRAFRDSGDADRNFALTFGLSTEAFERLTLRRLGRAAA